MAGALSIAVVAITIWCCVVILYIIDYVSLDKYEYVPNGERRSRARNVVMSVFPPYALFVLMRWCVLGLIRFFCRVFVDAFGGDK